MDSFSPSFQPETASADSKILILERENEQFKNEIQSLKKQYEEALLGYDELPNLQKENAELRNQISKQKETNFDLEKRLDISQNKCKNLESKVNSLTDSNNASINQQIVSLKQQIAELKSQNSKDSQNFQEVIEEQQQNIEELTKANQKLSSLQEKTLSFATCFFNIEFTNITEFNAFLHENKSSFCIIGRDQLEQAQVEQEQNSNDEAFIQVISKLKEKLQREKKKRNKAQLAIISIQQEHESLLDMKENKINQQKEMIRKLMTEQESRKLCYETEISELKAKLYPKTRNEATQVSLLVDDPSYTSSLHFSSLYNNEIEEEMNELRKKYKEQEQNLIDLQNQNSNLLMQLKQSQEQKEKLKQKFSSTRETREDNERLGDEIEKLKCDLDKKDKELQNLMNQYNAAKASNEEANTAFISATQEAKQTKQTINTLLDQFEKQKNEIEFLYNQRGKLVSLVLKQNNLSSFLDSHILNNILSNSNQTKETNKSDESKENERKQINDNSSEKEIVFDFTDFPQEIQTPLVQISNNTSASLQSRFNYITEIISKFIAKRTEQDSGLIKKLQKENKELINQKLALVESICSIFDDQKLDESTVVDFIKSYKDQFDQMDDELNYTNQKIHQLMNDLNVEEFSDIVNHHEDQQNIIDALQSKIERLNEKIKQKKEEKKAFKTILTKMQNKMENDTNMLKNDLNQSKEEVKRLSKENAEIQKKNISLINEITEIRQESAKEIEQLKEHYDFIINQSPSSSISSSSGISTGIDEMRHENIQLKKTLKGLQAEVDALSAASQSASRDLFRARKELSDKISQFEEYKLQNDQEHVQELIEKDQKYKSIIQEMKAKSSEDAALITKTTEALQVNEQRLQNVVNRAYELEKKNNDYEHQIQSMKDDFSRERRLLESQLKAAKVSCEVQLSNQVDIIQKEYESKEMNIYEQFASAFHSFVDPSQRIDHSSFLDTIHKINAEISRLQKLESSIRLICAAKSDVKTEDALSLYIIRSSMSQ